MFLLVQENNFFSFLNEKSTNCQFPETIFHFPFSEYRMFLLEILMMMFVWIDVMISLWLRVFDEFWCWQIWGFDDRWESVILECWYHVKISIFLVSCFSGEGKSGKIHQTLKSIVKDHLLETGVSMRGIGFVHILRLGEGLKK